MDFSQAAGGAQLAKGCLQLVRSGLASCVCYVICELVPAKQGMVVCSMAMVWEKGVGERSVQGCIAVGAGSE